MLAFFPCRLLIERRDDLLVPQCLQLFSTAAPRAEAPSIGAVPLNCPSGKLLCRLHFYAPTSPQSDYGTESQLFEENILQRCQKERLDEKKTPPLSCTTSVAEGHLQSTWEVSPRCQKNHKQLTVQTGAASEFFQYHRIWGYNSSRGRHRVFCTNIHSNIRRSQDGGWKGWGWDSHTETDTRRKETGNESTSFWGWRGTEEGSCL